MFQDLSMKSANNCDLSFQESPEVYCDRNASSYYSVPPGEHLPFFCDVAKVLKSVQPTPNTWPLDLMEQDSCSPGMIAIGLYNEMWECNGWSELLSIHQSL